MCSVAGWGLTSAHNKELPHKLREVDLKVLDDQTCLKYPGGTYSKYNTCTMMCVGDPKKRKGSFKVKLPSVLDKSLLLTRLLLLQLGPRAKIRDQALLR